MLNFYLLLLLFNNQFRRVYSILYSVYNIHNNIVYFLITIIILDIFNYAVSVKSVIGTAGITPVFLNIAEIPAFVCNMFRQKNVKITN